MNLQGFEDMIPHVAQYLNVEPATVLLLVGLIVAISNLLGRLIPDDKVGVLGTIRTIAKFIGLYASNRIASGLTVNEIAKTTVPMIEQISEVQESMESKIETATAAFPGFQKKPTRDPATGKFVKKEDE